MPLMVKIRSYCNSLLQRRQRESDISEEIAFHIAERAVDLKRGGLSAAEALRRARIEFGGVETHRAEIRSSLGLRWIDELRGDLHYAWRMLWRSKGFTAVAVGSLALGIGANTIIFSLAKGVLLDRLTVPHPEQLKMLTVVGGERSPMHEMWGDWYDPVGNTTQSPLITYPIYQLLQQQNREHSVLGDIFAFKALYRPLTITVDGRAEVVTAQMVSGNYYDQLGVLPQLGRTIHPPDDGAPGTGNVVMISDGLWTRAFGRSPNVIGKTIALNLVPMTIVGVTPAGFTGADSVQLAPDVFFPLSMQPLLSPHGKKGKTSVLEDKDLCWIEIMARILPNVTGQTAQAAVSTWMDEDIRGTMTLEKDAVMPQVVLMEGSRGFAATNHRFSTQIYVLASLTGFVLLLACANLANLLLARSASRQREIAVRMALGASRGRVLRQVLTESLLLSSLGGAAGLALGYLGRNVILHMFSPSWQTSNLRGDFDATVLAVTVGISLLTAMLFGIAPALQATRTPVNTGLKDAAASATRRRKGLAGRSLVVIQVALSMLLVIGGGLFARTLQNIYKQQPGFDTSNLVLFSIQPPEARYPGLKAIQLHERIEERLSTVPGVSAVTLSQIPLLTGGASASGLLPSGQPKGHTAWIHEVGRSFFDVYKIPIVYGRSFNSSDTNTSLPVAIINQKLAKAFWPNSNPVGQTFKMDDGSVLYTVIGIATDTRYERLNSDIHPTVFFPYIQSDGMATKEMTYEVKTALPAAAILPQLREAVAEVDRDLPLRDVRTQQQQIDATISQERTFAVLTAGFGVLALALACIGIYGLMAYDVARRTSEIGIRMALGARASQMLGMVLREASWMAVLGIGIGLVASLWLARFVKSMLYGLAPNDPWILSGAALLLFIVALAAGFGPARRAASVEPMEALRHE